MIYEPNIDVARTRGPYCGPTAVALLTGAPISRIEKMIRRRRRGGYRDVDGKKIPIRGTHPWEIVKVLELLGRKVTKVARVHGETLNSIVNDCLPSTGAFLIEVTGHFMVASSGMIADTAHKTPIPIASYKKKSRRVCAVWRVVAPLQAARPEQDVGDHHQCGDDPRPVA